MGSQNKLKKFNKKNRIPGSNKISSNIEELEQIQNFKYLGFTINEKNGNHY